MGIEPATFANPMFTNEEYSVEVDDLYNFARNQYGQYAQYLWLKAFNVKLDDDVILLQLPRIE
jgi:hypothetical protein